jgi:hypothetical protein
MIPKQLKLKKPKRLSSFCLKCCVWTSHFVELEGLRCVTCGTARPAAPRLGAT